MDSFMTSFTNRNNSFFDDQNDSLANLSSALNRSKLLLNETISSPGLKSKTQSGLLKASILQSKSMLSQSTSQETIDESSILLDKIFSLMSKCLIS